MGVVFYFTNFVTFGQKGMLKAIQGRNGGYQLGKPAHKISLYDVFRVVEGDLQFNRCLATGQRCVHGEEATCKMHDFLHGMQGKMIAQLAGVSIADLVA